MAEPISTSSPGPNRWLVLALVCVAQFMVVLDSTITNIAIPSIQQDLGLSTASSQWVVTGYTLLFGGFLLLGGRAGDLFGRKRVFLAGLGLFTAASLICGLASSAGVLITSRGAQGLGAAFVSPTALAIITTTFTGKERARALGVWAAIAAGGSAVGLLLGGVLTDSLSWQWIFFINVPIGVLAFLASLRFLPRRDAATAAGGFDVIGVVLGTAGLVLLTYGIVQAGTIGFGNVRTVAFLVGAVVLLVAFLVVERRVAAPILQLGIFRARALSVANIVTLLVMGALMSMFFFGSLYVQEIQHYNAIQAGLAFLPLAVGVLVGSVISQAVVGRVGFKAVLLIGLVVVAAGLLWATRLGVDSSYATGLLPTLIASSVGMGIVFVPLTLAATEDAATTDQGLASGIWNTSQQIGSALGLASLAAVASAVTGATRTPQAQVDGFDTAFGVAVGFAVVAFLVVAASLRRTDGAARADEAKAGNVADTLAS